MLIGLTACGSQRQTKNNPQIKPAPPISPEVISPEPDKPSRTHFAQFNNEYRFSAEISSAPSPWLVEYAPEIESINLYDPTAPGTKRNQSQIFPGRIPKSPAARG